MTHRIAAAFLLVATLGYPHPSVCQEASSPTLTDRLGDPLPPGALLRMGTNRFRSPGVVLDMAISGDDRTLVTVGEYLTAWDTETGRQLWRLTADAIGGRKNTAYGLRLVDVSADGKQFVACGHGRNVVSWEARTGVQTILDAVQAGGGSPRYKCQSIDVGNNGNLLAIGSHLGLVVCDNEGKTVFELSAPSGPPKKQHARDRLDFGGPFHYAILAPDATTLARVESGEGATIFIHETSAGEELSKIECKANVVRMDFSPDGKQLAVTERDTAVRLYNVDSGNLVWETEVESDRSIENYTSAIRFSPNGKLLAVGERQQQLLLIDATTGELRGKFKEHCTNPWAVAFSSDSSRLFSSGWGGVVHRWNVETLEQTPVPGAVLGTAVVAASHDGTTIAHVDRSDKIHVIAKPDGKLLRHLSLPGANYEYLAFSPDHRHLAAGGECDNKVHMALWDYTTGQLKHRWDWEQGKDPQSGIEEIEFSSDGSRLAAVSFRQSGVHLWETASGRRIAHKQHKSVYGLSFTADDQTLITAGWDKKLRFWDAGTGKAIESFEIPDDENARADNRMYTVSCDPSGELIATTHLMDVVRFWNADNYKLRGALDIDGSFVFGSSCFSPDGLWFVTGGGGKIQVWDPWSVATEPTELHSFAGHEDHVYTIEFAGDNRTLVSGGGGIAFLWDLRPELQATALPQQLEALLTQGGATAYQAWWGLVDGGDDSVELIKQETQAVTKVVNVDRMASGIDPKQRTRRHDLLTKMASAKKNTIQLSAAKRVISVLSHIDTAKSNRLLKDLASQGDDLGQLAHFELQRTGRGK